MKIVLIHTQPNSKEILGLDETNKLYIWNYVDVTWDLLNG